jgi:hypothetical protein
VEPERKDEFETEEKTDNYMNVCLTNLEAGGRFVFILSPPSRAARPHIKFNWR